MNSPRTVGAAGRALRAALTAFVSLLLVTCTDNPSAPGRAGMGQIRVYPRFDASASFVPLALDNIRILVIRPPNDTIKTITRSFPANQNQIQVTASDIELDSRSEDLIVVIELYSGTTLLFSGTDTVTVEAGVLPPAEALPVTYAGPGSNLDSLRVSPRDTVVPPGAVVPYTVLAFAAGSSVSQFYVSWSATAGTIDPLGSYTAPTAPGTYLVRAVSPQTSTRPNGVKDSTTIVVRAGPAIVIQAGGDQQSGLAGGRLPAPLQVRVEDASGQPVQGVDVIFAAATGGGSVDNATVTTGANGLASTGATLGQTPGQQTFTATASGLNTVTFTATALSGIQWTGAVDNNWHTAGNWIPAQVPGLSDNVIVPVTSRQPVVSTTANMNDLTINGGATVTLATTFTFNVAGNLTANGSLLVSGGTPTIQLSGTGKTLQGQVANATIAGTISLAANTTVSGNVTVSGGTASLDIGIFAMQVGGNFSTGSGGRLIMTTAGGQLNITGSAAFGGRDETGFLTAGSISVGGSFSQTGSGSLTSYAASGSHVTGFVGATATHTVNFGTPGAGAAGSHFNTLDISNTATVSLATDAFVDLLFQSTPSQAAPTLGTTGATHKLTAAGVSVTGLNVNQATLAIGAGTITAFNSVQFTNMPTTVAQLTVNNPGAATAFSFTSLSFATPPTSGFYMDVTDADGAAPSLVINMVAPTPAIPGNFVRTSGGAAVNWPSTTPILTWDGSVSPVWSNVNNWTPAQVPTSSDDVLIPSGTPNSPVFSVSCSAKSLTVNSGASFNLGTGNCTVAGNVFADGAITGTGAIAIATPAQIRGNFPSLILSAKITQTAPVAATGNVTVTGPAGSYVIGGQSLTMGGNLGVQGGARLVMLNPADLVTVTGNAVFSGGFELDSLDAGILSIGGNLTQVGNGGASTDSYHTSGTHQTIFTGTNPTITFGTPGDFPGSSHFQNFEWRGTGTLTLATKVFAHNGFTTTATGAVTVTSTVADTFQIGNYTGAGPITFNNVRLVLKETAGGPLALSNATFSGLASTLIPLSVIHPGTGGPFTFNNLTFSVTPTGAGRYISATDADGPTPTPLTINVTNSNPAVGPALLITLVNGAVVNWPPATPVRTWGGTISNNWFLSGNWVGGVAPATTDNVTIPSGTSFAPTIGSSTTVNDLTVQPGAVLSLGDINLNVTGNLDASGSVAGCCGDFIALSGGTLKGNFSQVVLSVSPGEVVTLNGATTLTNSTVQLAGELILNGNTLNVGQGTVITQNGTGLLTMTNAADQVLAGFMDFSGGNETGRLTAGVIRTRGLSQGGTVPTSFLTGGNHKVILGGPLPSTVSFANPGTSRFQDLDVTGVSATLTLGSNVTVAGQLISLPISGNGPAITGAGVTLTAGGADISALPGFTALTMDGVPLVLSGGAIPAFSRVTFNNQNPLGIHLTVNNVGQGSPFTFGNLSFTTGLSAGGFYIQANDLDGPTANGPLTIDVIGASPAAPSPSLFNATNGAVIRWPPIGGNFTWTGAVSSDWSVAGNWNPAQVPGVIDNVTLVPITNQPILTTSVVINNLTSTTGSILNLNGFVLGANGSVDVAGSITGATGVTLTGTGQTVRGTINTELQVIGSYVMNGNLTVGGNLSVQGSLDLGGFTAQVGGSFLTFNNGVLRMTNSADVLNVTGDAIFSGGSTAGLLKSGRITIAGNFSQIGTNSKQSFSADPGHLTVISLNGFADAVSISFTDPGGAGLSHFGDLSEGGFGATFNLNSDVTVLGLLSGGDGFGGTMVGTSCPTVLTVTSFSTSGPLNLNCVQLVVDDPGGTNIGINGVTFANLPTNVTQLTIRHPGLAAGSFSVFGTLTFVPLTTNDTGFYIAAVDTDGTAPLLVVAPSGTNVTNGPTFTTLSGGATVLWP